MTLERMSVEIELLKVREQTNEEEIDQQGAQ